MIGAAGEPRFEGSWENVPSAGSLNFEGAGFYKDREGIVHLKGIVKGDSSGFIFHLPAGYRPASGRALLRFALCLGAGCSEEVATILILGPDVVPGADGGITPPSGAESTSLEGISFRAEF